MRDACQVIRAEPGMSSTNMSSDVPKPEDVLWATFPLRLSRTRVGVQPGAFQLQPFMASPGDGEKIPRPWLHPRNSDLSAQTWPEQLSVLIPAEDAGAQSGHRSPELRVFWGHRGRAAVFP